MAKDNAKLVAVLSYITLIGWIIALILNMQNKSRLGSFHLRQALIPVLFLYFFRMNWVWIVSLIAFILVVVGLIAAINGEQRELPLIGEYAEKWFKGL